MQSAEWILVPTLLTPPTTVKQDASCYGANEKAGRSSYALFCLPHLPARKGPEQKTPEKTKCLKTLLLHYVPTYSRLISWAGSGTWSSDKIP